MRYCLLKASTKCLLTGAILVTGLSALVADEFMVARFFALRVHTQAVPRVGVQLADCLLTLRTAVIIPSARSVACMMAELRVESRPSWRSLQPKATSWRMWWSYVPIPYSIPGRSGFPD